MHMGWVSDLKILFKTCIFDKDKRKTQKEKVEVMQRAQPSGMQPCHPTFSLTYKPVALDSLSSQYFLHWIKLQSNLNWLQTHTHTHAPSLPSLPFFPSWSLTRDGDQHGSHQRPVVIQFSAQSDLSAGVIQEQQVKLIPPFDGVVQSVWHVRIVGRYPPYYPGGETVGPIGHKVVENDLKVL